MSHSNPFQSNDPFKEALAWMLLMSLLMVSTALGMYFQVVVFVLGGLMVAYGANAIVRGMMFLHRLGHVVRACEKDHVRYQQQSLDEDEGGHKSLLRQLLDALKAANEYRDEPDHQALLNGYATCLYGQNAMNRHAAAVLIALGMLGTMIGCTTMLWNLDRALGSEGEMNIDAALIASLKSMATVFVTTGLGCLLGGLILRGLTNIAKHSIDQLLAQLAALCAVANVGDE